MTTATVHKLCLPCHPPTLNALMRGKLRQRMRLSASWRLIVAMLSSDIPEATGKRRVTIKIVLGKGRRGADPDSYLKATGDALVQSRLLLDDSRHWVEWAPVEYERGQADRCEIELEDLP